MSSRKLANFSPGRVVLGALLCTVIVGACLLSLPCARTTSLSLIDIIFTTISATCVTGLFTIPLNNFTQFGHVVILCLIQIGGLGLITMTLFIVYLIMDVGLGTQLMASKLLEIDSWKNIKQILLLIVALTFCTEFLGACCLFPIFWQNFPTNTALFMAVFHSVSAFCNAGIWLLDHNQIQQYGNYTSVLFIMMILIFIGDLGFITWYEIARYTQEKRRYFSLHSKIIVYGSAILVTTATVLFLILELDNILSFFSWPKAILYSLFHITSFRSAGFIITDPGQLQLATLLMLMVLGFIGSSPASTGSGIKITTCAVFLATVKAAITNRPYVEIKGRTIAQDQVNKAIAIVFLSLFWIIGTTFFLLVTETEWDFFSILFETVMATTNVGISNGVTPTLSSIGKLFIMTSMIVGRIGSLTLILALTFRKHKKTTEFSYPEERIMLG